MMTMGVCHGFVVVQLICIPFVHTQFDLLTCCVMIQHELCLYLTRIWSFCTFKVALTGMQHSLVQEVQFSSDVILYAMQGSPIWRPRQSSHFSLSPCIQVSVLLTQQNPQQAYPWQQLLYAKAVA